MAYRKGSERNGGCLIATAIVAPVLLFWLGYKALPFRCEGARHCDDPVWPYV